MPISDRSGGRMLPVTAVDFCYGWTLGMSTRIAWIGNEIAHRAVGDDQPRRFYRRYFVHTGTSPKR
jgi:hypothetical protein